MTSQRKNRIEAANELPEVPAMPCGVCGAGTGIDCDPTKHREHDTKPTYDKATIERVLHEEIAALSIDETTRLRLRGWVQQLADCLNAAEKERDESARLLADWRRF